MTFTRLHFILLFLLLGAITIVVLNILQKNIEQAPKTKIEQPTATVPATPVVKTTKTEPRTVKPEFARKAVAVAGEYWKITKKKDLDFLEGQETLQQAKIELANSNYNEAYHLGRLSIVQFKSAPKLGVRYIVRYADNLWKIAKMKIHYGKGSKWVKIWRANQDIIPDFDLIHPRQNLYVPGVRKQQA